MNSSIENKENVYNFSDKAADPKTIFVMNLHGDAFHSNERTWDHFVHNSLQVK